MSFLCRLLTIVALTATAAASDDWWNHFPRIVQTDSLSTANSHHSDIAFIGALRDPGWGIYGQRVTFLPWELDQFQHAGFRNIGYFETFGQSMTFIAEFGPGGGDFTPVTHIFWNWQLYAGGPIGWIGVHNYFDDTDFAQPYTRTHPRYSGPPMYYPDGALAGGFDGDPNDPRNNRVYDAGCAKTILGDVALTYGYNPVVNAIDPNTGQPAGPLDGLLYVPADDQYAGLISFNKDPACPYWNDFTYASTLAVADEGLDGMWTDNYSAWDGQNIRPVLAAFGDWSVARFRDHLAANFTPAELTAMGVTDVATFDVRAALMNQMTAWGGNPYNLDDFRWSDARWLDHPLWHAYLIFKRQSGEEALQDYYTAAKTAAAVAGNDAFLVCGNDIPVFSLGWVRGALDMVSTEVSAGWNLCSGPRGFMIPPVGRMAPFYKLAREHARSRFVNVWLYTDGYETELAQTGVSTTMYYEMLASHTLPMFYPLSANPTVAGSWAGNTAFFDFVEQAAPTFGERVPIEDIGVYYSSSSVLARMTPGGTLDHANQPHQFATWGWMTALGELHHQYRPIPEWKLDAETLAGLRLLIIPASEVFETAPVSDVLLPWIEAGGRLIVTNVSGRRDGEAGNFAIHAGGYALAPLTGITDIVGAPATQTQDIGAGRVHYIRDSIGHTFFNASTTRPALLGHFASALDIALANTGPDLVTPGAGVTANVGIALHEDVARQRLFIDVNNFDVDAASDTITPTAPLTFTVQAPAWLAPCAVQASVISPDVPTPTANASMTMPGELTITLGPVTYFASVMVEPTTLADADGDGVSDACDACPGTPADQLVSPDGCELAQVEDTILFNVAGAIAGTWRASRTQLPPDAFYDGDPTSAGSTVLNDAALVPNPNLPLVGDLDGDGVSDLAVAGWDATLDQQVFLGRLTGVDSAGHGDLNEPSPAQGWPTNAVAIDAARHTFFLGDVNGDGRDDAIAARDWGSDGIRWEAQHSGINGLADNNGSSSSVAGHADSTLLVGDFDGDGRTDIGERLNSILPGWVYVYLSAHDGSGLKPTPTLADVVQGATEEQPTEVATLVGDINGDGRDDIVVVDDRWGTGQYIWVADVTAPAAEPSGLAIGAGGKSWAFPFSEASPPADVRVPLLADLNGDGCDDLVEYREFANTSNPGQRYGQWVVAYTNPATGNLFDSTFDDGGTIELAAAEIGNTPLIGHFNFAAQPEHCTNGIDDDGDGRVDCADDDCDGTFACECGMWPEDRNGDGTVNHGDLALLAGCMQGPLVGGGAADCPCSDLDVDGDVDLADLAILAECTGNACMP